MVNGLARGRMHRRLLLIAIVVVIVILASTVAWIVLRGRSRPTHITYTYSIGVSAPGGTAYYLLLPIIVDVNGSVTPIMEDFAVDEGSGTFELTDTQYGRAVNLTGQGYVYAGCGMTRTLDGDYPPLNWSRHPKGDMDLNLWTGPDANPEDHDLGSVWVYVHAEWIGQPLSFGFTLAIGDIKHQALFEATQDGWQTVEVYATAVVP